MRDVVEQCRSRLSEFGIDLLLAAVEPRGYDIWGGEASLRRASTQASYRVLWGPQVRLQEIHGQGDLTPGLVLTSLVAPRTAEALRRAGIQYVDAEGNAWIEFGDVLIDVRGRKSTQPANARQPRPSGDLFSSGRAQVVMALLAWPFLWTAPQRELARAAGVSLGQSHNTLRILENAGYGPWRRHPQETELLRSTNHR